jgi:hypothetical protein
VIVGTGREGGDGKIAKKAAVSEYLKFERIP